MKLLAIILAFFFSINCFAQNEDVKNTITIFFDGFHAKDTLQIQSVCSSNLILQSIADNGIKSRLTSQSVIEFLSSIASIPDNIQFKEELLGMKVEVDGTMAHVWTPYRFIMNESISHSGVNSFTLFKENGIWKIIHIIDTRRK
jgi:hypothetical protein